MENVKIDLILSGNKIFVWSADDWLKLRQEHRIIGDCIGCIAKKPRQNIISGLPMVLLPEEAKILIDNGICNLIQQPALKEIPTQSLKKKFDEYRNKLYTEQQQCLIDQRKIQIESVLDEIVEGKKRKRLGLQRRKRKLQKPLDDKTQKALDDIIIDRDVLIAEEMAKLPQLDKSDALVQTHTAYPWHTDHIKIENWNYPSNDEESLKYKVFKDIWEQGYYITSGQKFGSDFLVYPGDPIMFHSQYLIHCKNRHEEMSVLEIIAEGRIGCHVRKTLVFATLSDDGENVEYFSSRWADSSMGEL